MQSQNIAMRPLEVPLPSPADDMDLAPAPVPARQSLAAATSVQTPKGLCRLDELSVGQHVLTRSGTYAAVTGIDHTRFTQRHLHDNPDFAPIRFDAGALPGMSEDGATLISPDCPVAWTADPADAQHFPARAFCDGGLIRWVIPEDGIHFIRLHFEHPQQICAGGIWVDLSPEDQPEPAMPRPVPKLVQEIRIFRPITT